MAEHFSRQESPLIAVCGPGRSGTSLVMSYLVDLGLHNPGEMIGPNPRNEAGFWEDRGAVNINRRLLAAWGLEGLGGFAVPMPKSWIKTPEAKVSRDELTRYLSGLRPPSGPWGFKDPRISVLLPLWRDAATRIGSALNVVVVVRQPASMSLSLRAATGAPIELGELVWLNRISHIIRYATGPVTLVHLEDLVSNPRFTLSSLVAPLNLRPELADGAVERALKMPRFQPSLLHHTEPHEPTTKMVQELYYHLRSLSGSVEFGEEARHIVARYFALQNENLGWQAAVRFLQCRVNERA